jgi:hypothetical protein
MHAKCNWNNLNGRNHLGDLGVDGRIIVNWSSGIRYECGLNSSLGIHPFGEPL